jgi:hypothetical protein
MQFEGIVSAGNKFLDAWYGIEFDGIAAGSDWWVWESETRRRSAVATKEK